MSATLIEHNRRAVYTALSGVCTDRLLLERAFVFWEKNFSAQGVFRVAQYIDDLMNQVGLSQELRRALSIALYSCLNKQDRELAELPAIFRKISQPEAAAPAARISGQAQAPQAVVLGKILSGIIDAVARAGRQDDLADALRDASAQLSPALHGAGSEWLQSGLVDTTKFVARVPAAEHGAIVSHVYVALCDALGPVLADRILARAVEAAEVIPEAVSCPPRTFL